VADGLLETEIQKMLDDAFTGAPDALKAKMQERSTFTTEEMLRINVFQANAARRCIVRLAREIDHLSGRQETDT
jgi:hypothetical protein